MYFTLRLLLFGQRGKWSHTRISFTVNLTFTPYHLCRMNLHWFLWIFALARSHIWFFLARKLTYFAFGISGFLNLIRWFLDSQLQIILINLPDILLLYFEINFIGIHKLHFIIIPKLNKSRLHDSFACNYIITILVCSHTSREPFYTFILIKNYYVVWIDISCWPTYGLSQSNFEYAF